MNGAWNEGPRHWRDKAISWGAKRIVRPLLAAPIPWSIHRAGFALGGILRLRARGVKTHETTLARMRVLIHTPPSPKRRLVWVHGGGFVVGSPQTHRAMCTHLARALDAVVIAPSYRLAPENPFPAGFEDVLRAVGEAESVRPELGPLILAGDSAGGCLVMAALAARLRAGANFSAVLLSSPASYVDPEREPAENRNDLLFPLTILQRIARDYIGDGDPDDPRLSPAAADFTGAPPTLIHCVEGEYLEEDSDRLADALRASGAEVTVEKARLVPHAFHYMAGASPRADAAIARMAEFLDAI